MRIFDETKTKELENPDLSKGRLGNDVIVTHHEGREGTQEQGHYEVVAEYPNGGKDVKWIVDIPAVLPVAPYDTEEDIYVYIPYTEKELKQFQIAEIKQRLQKYKEDVEQVELFGMERSDYEEKKRLCADMIIELRSLEKCETNSEEKPKNKPQMIIT